MIIDCDRCAVRGTGCSDCVITVLLDAPPTIELEEPELRALDTLADAGLVPHLRLIPVRPAGTGADVPSATSGKRAGSAEIGERSNLAGGRQRRQVS